MTHFEPELIDAIKSLNPNASFSVGNNDISDIKWGDGTTPISTSDIQTELNRLKAEWTANEYARNRATEYPSIADLVVALYDTDDKSAVEAKRAAVKAKYPKP